MKNLLFILLTIAGCSKKDQDNGELKDWTVKYEITSTVSGDKAFFGYSTGTYMKLVGNTAYPDQWTVLPWVKDTVFKRADGNRALKIYLGSLYNKNTPEGISKARIYINGEMMRELIGPGETKELNLY